MSELNLTINEKRVLQAIAKKDKIPPEELAQTSGLKIEAAMQSSFLLAEKKLSNISEEISDYYELTSEGEKYAKEGLPERQIMEYFEKNSKNEFDIILLKKIFYENIEFGVSWLLKKRWAKIEKGKIISLIPKPNKGEDEKFIEELNKNKRIYWINVSDRDRDVVYTLEKRNLIEKFTEKKRTVSITDGGIELVNKGITIKKEIAQLTPTIIKNWKNYSPGDYRPYNIHTPVKPVYGAKIHPYQRLINEMRRIFLDMGFTEIKGDIVQSSFWNFDALFQPQDHPAREMQDTFHLDTTCDLPGQYVATVKNMHETGGDIGSTGWGGIWSEEVARKQVLRTHTTAVTIKYLAENPDPPVKAFCIDRAYRREAIDPTHTPEFEQLEGVVMDRGVSFKNLLALLTEFYHRMGFEEVRFRPGYFPYTEPSVEPEVYIESMGRWVELGGAGVFRKEVTSPLGIKYPVLAWGLGVSRVAMLRLGLKDLRELYQSDIDWLRKSPVL